jgi:AhpD family alkylhydroperoxidase
LNPVKPSKAKGLVYDVYSQIKKDFGRIVEPFTLHSPIPKLLAGVWMVSRESELVGNVNRDIKEAVAASISKINKCPYCVDAHTIMIRATGKKEIAQLISQGQYDKINPLKTRQIVKWALSTTSPDSNELSSPPFEAKEAPEIIGTAIFYHYINPLVNIFLGNSPLPIPIFKTQMKKVAAHFLFKKAVNRSKKAGISLSLLPKSKLPEDLLWTKESSIISGAYGRLAGIIKEFEESIVPKQTQQLVSQYLNNWPRNGPKLKTNWLEEATIKMKPEIKLATKLALLTIFSPFRITKELINNFRSYYPTQEQLLGITAWASFTRARNIGRNLGL